MNHSINQYILQSVNQSINVLTLGSDSIKQSTYLTINKSMFQIWANQLINHLMNVLTCLLEKEDRIHPYSRVSQSINQCILQSINHSINVLTCLLEREDRIHPYSIEHQSMHLAINQWMNSPACWRERESDSSLLLCL